MKCVIASSCRWSLALVMAVTGAAKLVAPADVGPLPPAASVGLGLVEAAVAVAMILDWRVVVLAWVTLALVCSGLLLGWIGSWPCGCVGSLAPLSRTGHLVLAGLTGLSACGVIDATRLSAPEAP